MEKLTNAFLERYKNPFLKSFIGFWITINWKIFYITIFIDSELLLESKHILKIDYIKSFYSLQSEFLIFSYIQFWIVISKLLLLPLLFTYLFTYILQKYFLKFNKKHWENEKKSKEARNIILEKKNLEVEKIKEETLNKKEKNLEKSKKIEKTEEEKWEIEYTKFKKSKYYKEFRYIKESIYIEEGRVKTQHENAYNQIISTFGIPHQMLAYSDVNQLIEIYKDISGNELIKLTKKGKYFMKRYLDDNPK